MFFNSLIYIKIKMAANYCGHLISPDYGLSAGTFPILIFSTI